MVLFSSKWLFYGLLALLAWAPLPLGSNRDWAWALLVVGSFLLSIGWLGGYLLGQFSLTDSFRRARWALAILVLWLCYIALQFVALPADLIQLLSPRAYEAHAAAADTLGQPLASALTLSLDPDATQSFWLKTLAYVCAFCLTLLLVDTRQRLELLLKTLVICGTVQAFFASVMVLSGLEYSFIIKKVVGQGTATGTFINRNHLAGYLNICLALGIGLMISKLGGEVIETSRQRLRSITRLLLSDKTRLRVCLILMVIALVLSRSRMGNGAFFASILIVGTLGILLMRKAPRSTLFFLASLIALDILLVGTWFGVDQVAKRIQDTQLAANTVNPLPSDDRDEISHQAINYAKDYWLTGSGAGTFFVTFPGYNNGALVAYYDHAHNDYLEILAETGVIGLGLSALVVILAAVQALKALRRRHDPLMRGTAFGVAMAICWLAIHSSVDFNMQIPSTALTMTVVLALAWVAATLRQKRT